MRARVIFCKKKMKTEIRAEKRKVGIGVLGGPYAHVGLLRKAKAIVKATARSAEAKSEVLYSLPGIFAMELREGRNAVRLIKEGDALRIMKSSEKSDVLLVVEFSDIDAERGSMLGKVPTARLLAEGRIVYRGRGKYFNCFQRIAYIADKMLLSDSKFQAIYGAEI